MSIALGSLLAICGVEYALRVPLLACTKSLIEVVNKSIAVIRTSKTSDRWKEMELLRYAREMMGHTLSLALMLMGLFLLVFLPATLMGVLLQLSPPILDSFSSAQGLITITIVSAIYVVARRRFFST